MLLLVVVCIFEYYSAFVRTQRHLLFSRFWSSIRFLCTSYLSKEVFMNFCSSKLTTKRSYLRMLWCLYMLVFAWQRSLRIASFRLMKFDACNLCLMLTSYAFEASWYINFESSRCHFNVGKHLYAFRKLFDFYFAPFEPQNTKFFWGTEWEVAAAKVKLSLCAHFPLHYTLCLLYIFDR